jgi:ABC-type dipeptide/oligopeptide/nickel transport system permease component
VHFLGYLVQRLVLLVIVLLGVVSLTFVASRAIPGDPAVLLAGPVADRAAIDAIRAQLGTDKPLWTQYQIYMAGLARGDLGNATHTGNKVVADLTLRLPATLELLLVAFLVATGLGVPLGIWSAVRRNHLPDHATRIVNVLGVSVPQFWLGLILIYFLFYQLHLFPAPLGRLPIGTPAPDQVTGLYLIDSLVQLRLDTFRQALWQLGLPTLSLGFAALAPITRVVRNTMIEVLQSEHIQVARAYGLRNAYIYLVYALRNALLPIITLLGILFGNLLSGSVLVETIFSWPGVGFYAADSVFKKDYAAIQGFVIVSATLYVLVFLATDVMYWLIDPRTREMRRA